MSVSSRLVLFRLISSLSTERGLGLVVMSCLVLSWLGLAWPGFNEVGTEPRYCSSFESPLLGLLDIDCAQNSVLR